MSITENPIRNGVDTADLFATLDAVKGDTDIAKFQLPGHQHLAERDPQPVDDPRLPRRQAGDDAPRAVHATTPTTRRSWSGPTTVRRRLSTCCTRWPPA